MKEKDGRRKIKKHLWRVVKKAIELNELLLILFEVFEWNIKERWCQWCLRFLNFYAKNHYLDLFDHLWTFELFSLEITFLYFFFIIHQSLCEKTQKRRHASTTTFWRKNNFVNQNDTAKWFALIARKISQIMPLFSSFTLSLQHMETFCQLFSLW